MIRSYRCEYMERSDANGISQLGSAVDATSNTEMVYQGRRGAATRKFIVDTEYLDEVTVPVAARPLNYIISNTLCCRCEYMERSEANGISQLGSVVDATSNTEMATGSGDDDVDEDGCDQEETSTFETHVKSLPTEWTDEKHSLYLKSMEASFVDQLYNSMGFPSFEPSRKVSIETKPHLRSSVRTSTGQFKTLRDGSWQKINVGKGDVQLDGQHSSHVLLSNQWIRHYRHSERHHLLESNVSHGKAAATDQDMNSRGKASLPYRFMRSLKISNTVIRIALLLLMMIHVVSFRS